MRYSLIPVIAVLTLLSNFAYAHDVACYQPSPNLRHLGAAYYDLEKTSDLSQEEKNRIHAFFNAISGNWKGDARTIDCRGPDSASQIKMREAAVSAHIHLDSIASLSIDANKHFIEDSVKQSEHLALLGHSPFFGLEFDDALIFSEKYRRLNQPIQKTIPNPVQKPKQSNSEEPSSNLNTIINKITGNEKDEETSTKKPAAKKLSRMTETIYNIYLENGLLIISRAYYTNGVFTGTEIWRLSRE